MPKLRSTIFAGFLFAALPLATFAEVEFSVGWAPPPLPVVVQPACPVAGYIWTPGYWSWDDYYYDYYWVPGAWVPPPRVGLLWTPGWWGWNNGAYVFNQGYWGPTVGFYGGINYGYGYTGNGYWGGRWSGNTFQYNTAVTHVNRTVINNTYVNNSFQKNVNANRTSFNGGNNGIKAEPNAEQRKAMANANKVGPTSQQLNRQQAAAKDKSLLASTNKGKPNQDAIRSFNKKEGVGQGKGGEGLGAQGGKPEHNAGNMAGSRGKGAGMNAEERGNRRNVQGSNATVHSGKIAKQQGFPHGQNATNQQFKHHQQMGGQHQMQQMKRQGHPQKMGGQFHPNMQSGGNRPHPGGQQQGKKKEGKH